GRKAKTRGIPAHIFLTRRLGGPATSADRVDLRYRSDLGAADRSAHCEDSPVSELRDGRIPTCEIQKRKLRPLPRYNVEGCRIGRSDTRAVVAPCGQQTAVWGDDVSGAKQFREAIRDSYVGVGPRVPEAGRRRSGDFPGIEHENLSGLH